MDYAFIQESGETVTVLTAIFIDTGYCMANVVPQKGAHPFAVRLLTRFLSNGGLKPYDVHSDSEPSVTALARAAVKELNNGSRVITAPRGSHSSIGSVERLHQEVHGSLRALRQQTEKNMGEKVNVNSPVFAWLVRHVGLQARFGQHLGSNAYAKQFGHSYTAGLAHFGESAHTPIRCGGDDRSATAMGRGILDRTLRPGRRTPSRGQVKRPGRDIQSVLTVCNWRSV